MKPPYTLHLPWPPSTNRLWRRGKGKRVYRHPDYVAWTTEAGWWIRQQVGHIEPIVGAFKADIKLQPPNKRHRDLDNCVKAVLDLVEHMGIVANDKHCRQLVVGWAELGTQPVGVLINLSEM